MTSERSHTLVCTHCGGTLFARELDDSFSCLICGRAARAAAVARRAAAPRLAQTRMDRTKPYSAPYSA